MVINSPVIRQLIVLFNQAPTSRKSDLCSFGKEVSRGFGIIIQEPLRSTYDLSLFAQPAIFQSLRDVIIAKTDGKQKGIMTHKCKMLSLLIATKYVE